jgi:sortase A
MTDDTALAEPPPPGPRHGGTKMNTGDRVRFVLRGIGQTLITCGLVVLLFVVYEVYVTNIFAHQAQSKVHTALEKEWAQGQNPLLPLPGSTSVTIATGTGIANIYIPRLGKDFGFTVVEGTDDGDLEKGPGHYLHTALPGAVGNFAVAGHRVGKGEPFLNLDKLKPGDAVIIETKTSWYVYKINGDVKTGNLSAATPNNLVGSQVVNPSDGNVILPVPDNPGATPIQKLITLTTCTPKFSASQRLILHGTLDPSLTVPRTSDTKPASIEALYSQVS